MPQLPSLVRRRPVDLITAPISAFESETAAVIQQTQPKRHQSALYAIAVLLAISIFLMCVVTLDRVVQSTGRMLPTEGSVFIQPFQEEIITRVRVHNGDMVRKGQVIADLDPTSAMADLVQLQKSLSSGQALVDRLTAEQDRRPYMTDPKSHDSLLQAAIFLQRQAQYCQSITNFDEQMLSDAAVMKKSREDAIGYGNRAGIALQEEKVQQDLQKAGFGSTLLLLGASDNRVEMQRNETENKNLADQALHDMQSQQAQKEAFIGQWDSDVGTQLVAARTALETAIDGIAKAQIAAQQTTLVSPIDAIVQQIGQISLGTVITLSGNPNTITPPLFTLTPTSGGLRAELMIAAQDVAFVTPGQKVNLLFDAYRFTYHGIAHGVVTAVSPSSYTQTDDGQVVQPFYKVYVKLTEVRLRNVPRDFKLTPGLTLEGNIIVGKRTIMYYLIEGGLRTGDEAMREP